MYFAICVTRQWQYFHFVRPVFEFITYCKGAIHCTQVVCLTLYIEYIHRTNVKVSCQQYILHNSGPHQFGQLGRPSVCGEDVLARDPVLVDPAELLDGRPPLCRVLLPTDQHPVRVQQVFYSCALSQELGIRQNLNTYFRTSNKQIINII